MEEFTVYYDDGTKPVFEKFPTREAANQRLFEVTVYMGHIAIILEDWDE